MVAISAFRVTQHSQIFFHFSLEIEFNALHFINYTIPRLCSTYAVATLRVCSHEPGTVNYPGVNDCPGASVTSGSHDGLLSWGNVAPGQLHCPGTSSSSSDHYEFIRIPLVFTRIEF